MLVRDRPSPYDREGGSVGEGQALALRLNRSSAFTMARDGPSPYDNREGGSVGEGRALALR